MNYKDLISKKGKEKIYYIESEVEYELQENNVTDYSINDYQELCIHFQFCDNIETYNYLIEQLNDFIKYYKN